MLSFMIIHDIILLLGYILCIDPKCEKDDLVCDVVLMLKNSIQNMIESRNRNNIIQTSKPVWRCEEMLGEGVGMVV